MHSDEILEHFFAREKVSCITRETMHRDFTIANKRYFLKDSNLPNRPIFMDSKRKLKPKFLIHLDHLYSISVNEIGVHSSFADLLSI